MTKKGMPPAPTPSPSAREPHPLDLYGMLKQWACEEYPDDLEQAFRALCRYVRLYVDPDSMRFKLWASDFRNREDAYAPWIPEQAQPLKKSGFEHPFQARQSRLGMAS
jgi:hypothetical protein